MKPFSRIIFLLLALILSNPSAADGKKKWNVLFIMSDDLNCDLGSYGHPVVKSPHLDKLARSGVRFEHAYCQYPLCNPSRASMMTGRRPDTTGVLGNGNHFRKKLPDVATLPELFKKNGYYSARVGKIYHYGVPGQIGTSGMDDPQSWDEVINPSGHDRVIENKIINLVPTNRNIGGSLTWINDPDSTDKDQTDGKVATETIRLLEKNKDKPFFIACGFFRPHVPCIAPQKYFDMYSLKQIQLQQNVDEEIKDIPPAALRVRPPNHGIEETKLKEMKRAYYASVTFMDAQVGRVLNALERLGLAENTIVTFVGDHGWCLGEHGQWQKMLLFEEVARVPMIIYVPGEKGNGRSCSRPVELIDFYPTLAEYAGLTAPSGFEGKSLKPLLQNPKAEWDRPAFTQVSTGDRKGRSVRTERWRYTEWADGKAGTELYDHEKDPREYQNLANDPKYKDVIAKLSPLLRAQGPQADAEAPVKRKRKDQ